MSMSYRLSVVLCNNANSWIFLICENRFLMDRSFPSALIKFYLPSFLNSNSKIFLISSPLLLHTKSNIHQHSQVPKPTNITISIIDFLVRVCYAKNPYFTLNVKNQFLCQISAINSNQFTRRILHNSATAALAKTIIEWLNYLPDNQLC
jgi:hypothetical protein